MASFSSSKSFCIQQLLLSHPFSFQSSFRWTFRRDNNLFSISMLWWTLIHRFWRENGKRERESEKVRREWEREKVSVRCFSSRLCFYPLASLRACVHSSLVWERARCKLNVSVIVYVEIARERRRERRRKGVGEDKIVWLDECIWYQFASRWLLLQNSRSSQNTKKDFFVNEKNLS